MSLDSISEAVRKGDAFERDMLLRFAAAPVGEGASQHLAAQFLRLSLMHSGALRALAIDHPMSALALVRPQIEACLRGLWVLEQGNAYAERFMRDLGEGEVEEHIPKRVEQLLKDLESSAMYGPMVDSLRRYWTEFESAFHGYTHGGRIALQLLDNGIEPERLHAALKHSRGVAGFAFMFLLECIDSPDALRQQILAKVARVLVDDPAE